MADAATDLSEAHERLLSALEVFVVAVQTKTTDVTVKLGISMPQLRALRIVTLRGRLSGRQLAQELGVTPASVVPICDRLEEQGYLERVPDEHDRRITWLQLSPKGQRHSREIARAMRRLVGPVINRLAAGECERLAGVLQDLAAVVSENASGVGSLQDRA